MSAETPFAADPSERLTAIFGAAAARMAGLAFVNPALEVEAVAFAPWEGHWLGVMLTPWCMNLVLAPRDPALWRHLPLGAKRVYRFPAGDYEFVGAHDADVGEYHVCSLFSPVLEFDDHATARLVAALAREALLDPANAEAEGTGPTEGAPRRPLARLEAALDSPLSKRDFLRGRLRGAPP